MWYNISSLNNKIPAQPTTVGEMRHGNGVPMSDCGIVPPLKSCNKCGDQLPATTEYFHKDPKGQNGLSYKCKECAKAISRQLVADNTERNKENCSSYYRNNQDKVRAYRENIKEERKEKRKLSDQRYRQKNKTRLLKYNQQYKADRPGWSAQAASNWRKRNPEKDRATMHRRLARLQNAPGSHTADDILEMYLDQSGHCGYCGITLHDDYHVEHQTPLSRGGSNSPANLVLACPACNSSKGNKTVAEWEAVRGW